MSDLSLLVNTSLQHLLSLLDDILPREGAVLVPRRLALSDEGQHHEVRVGVVLKEVEEGKRGGYEVSLGFQ